MDSGIPVLAHAERARPAALTRNVDLRAMPKKPLIVLTVLATLVL